MNYFSAVLKDKNRKEKLQPYLFKILWTMRFVIILFLIGNTRCLNKKYPWPFLHCKKYVSFSNHKFLFYFLVFNKTFVYHTQSSMATHFFAWNSLMLTLWKEHSFSRRFLFCFFLRFRFIIYYVNELMRKNQEKKQVWSKFYRKNAEKK